MNNKDFCYCTNEQCDICKECERFFDNHTFKEGDSVWIARCKGGKDCTMFLKLREWVE